MSAIEQFKLHNQVKLDRIYNEFNKIKRSAREFIKNRLGPNQPRHYRTKRAVFNFVGEISNILFGTSTEKSINEIHEEMQKQSNYNMLTANKINLHSQILNETIADLASLHAFANKTTIALKALELAQQESNNINFKIQIMSSILTELEINLNIVRGDYQNLINGISDFMDSYPSTHIISDSLFSELLSAAAQRGNGLLFPQQLSNIGLFRETSRIFSRHLNDGGIMFFLTIPLKSHTYGEFNVYEVNSLPLPLPNTTQFIEYIPDSKYLAVSDDSDRFLQFNDINHCVEHMSTLICHPKSPIMNSRASNCMYNIFNSKPNNTCRKVIMKNFTPRFIRVKDGFIYATDTPLVLRADCGSERRIVKISNSGFLPIRDECDISTDTFSIPSHMSMHSNEIQFPIGENPISYIIPSNLQPFTNDPEISNIISSINTDMPISLTNAVSHLSLLKAQDANNEKLTSWTSSQAYTTPGSALSFGTITLVLFIVGIVLLMYYKSPFLKSIRTLIGNTKILKESSKGLDALQEGAPVGISNSDIQQAFEILLKPN